MRGSRFIAVAAAAATIVSVLAGAASADQTGLADMHTWKKVGRKSCFADHTHYGSSTGERSEKAAKAAAAKAWAEFTAFEYGTDWANFRKAIGVKFECSQSSGGWGCALEATPCR